MPQATCREQEINRRFSTPFGKRAGGGPQDRVIGRSGNVLLRRSRLVLSYQKTLRREGGVQQSANEKSSKFGRNGAGTVSDQS
jgi:hypothetical protein